MNIGNNIKKYRKIKGLTQIQLAEKINKSESIIRKYEANNVKPNIEMLNKISDALNVSVSELISDENTSQMIGKNVSKYREALSISQRELARRVGMSGQFISKIENNLNNPSLETLNKIAEALNVSVSELISDENTSHKTLADYSTSELLIELARRCDNK